MKVKRRRRVLSVILLTVLLVSSISGCGIMKTGNNGDGVLTIHMHFFGTNVFNDDWPVFKKAEEITGVKLKGTASSVQSDSSQAYSNMLVEGKLPDIVHYIGTELSTLGMQGGLIPLEDLIDKYAPNIKKAFEESPKMKKLATAADGHIYYIPGSLSGIDRAAVPSQGWFIRQDWLDKLGLKIPTTVQEYYETMKAFKEKDPNGNGIADEIPIFSRTGNVDFLYPLFGVNAGWYIKDDGTLGFGAIEESYKNAVIEIAKWYKEGIIDSEIFTRGGQAREQLLSRNLGGSTHDWFSSTGGYNDSFSGEVEGLNFVPFAPPADINGKVAEISSRNVFHTMGWGISKDNDDVETTIKYFDFWMSEKGRELNAYGVEGIHNKVVNGKRVYTDTVLKAKEGVSKYLRNQGAILEIGTIGSLEAELSGMNKIARSGFEMYDEGGYVLPQIVVPQFTKEEQDVINANYNNITTHIKECTQKWIFGSESIDENWKSYLQTLDKMKINDIIKIYNTAYSREN